MKFLCLCYYDITAFFNFGAQEFEQMRAICAPRDAEFKASGQVNFIGSLGMPDQFKTIRAKTGNIMIENGPYAQTKEPFGAFFIVEANDIEEATKIAQLHPGVHISHLCGGGIEVCPIESFEPVTPLT